MDADIDWKARFLALGEKLHLLLDEVRVTEQDCGTLDGIKVAKVVAGGELFKSLADRCDGRASTDDIDDLDTGAVLAASDEMLLRDKSWSRSLRSVTIRSPLSCRTVGGVCALCYGRGPTGSDWVAVGTEVGQQAADAIMALTAVRPRPTFHNFHIGWTDLSKRRPTAPPEALFFAPFVRLLEATQPAKAAVMAMVDGIVRFPESSDRPSGLTVVSLLAGECAHPIPPEARDAVVVEDGQSVRAGDGLTNGDTDPHAVLCVLGREACAAWILDEWWVNLGAQGGAAGFRDVAVELVLRRMLAYVTVVDAGVSSLAVGAIVTPAVQDALNLDAITTGTAVVRFEPVLLGVSELVARGL